MKRVFVLTAVTLLAASLHAGDAKPQPGDAKPAADAKPPAEAKAPEKSNSVWEHYSIIVKQNIFSKDRGKAAAAAETQAKPIPKPEADLQLVGIVERDGKLIAFVENRKTVAVQALHSGDAIAGGKVGAVTLESIEFVSGNSTGVVTIGKTLDGGTPPKPAEGEKSAGVSSETNDILEKLKRKRQEELKK